MLAQVKSMSLLGINGTLINVQVDISSGLPSWDIVGLPDVSVKESRQRVRSALKNIGISLPSRKVTINLAPANQKKEGSLFDLPIAVGILCNLNIVSQKDISSYLFVGELSLDGTLNKVNGTLPICIEALNSGIKKIFVPYENRFEAGILSDAEIYPVKSLKQVVDFFTHTCKIQPFKTNMNSFLSDQNFSDIDFSDVKGQENAKRALEIAAAGGHNCLLIGSPRFRENNAI